MFLNRYRNQPRWLTVVQLVVLVLVIGGFALCSVGRHTYTGTVTHLHTNYGRHHTPEYAVTLRQATGAKVTLANVDNLLVGKSTADAFEQTLRVGHRYRLQTAGLLRLDWLEVYPNIVHITAQ